MLTLFTVPKPFTGHTAIIQRNAIRSWAEFINPSDILLLGNETGVAQVAKELDLTHLNNIELNNHGTPLIGKIFEKAISHSQHHFLCFINSDIILLENPVNLVKQCHFDKFLIVGKRIDLDVDCQIKFEDIDWLDHIKQRVQQSGHRHPPSGIDYFIFPRNTFPLIPDFAIGRTAWDNWFIYKAIEQDIPVIDATQALTAIHQDHDYSHIAGGKKEAWQGKESEHNRNLAGGLINCTYDIRDANYQFQNNAVKKKKLTREYIAHRLRRLALRKPKMKPLVTLINNMLLPSYLLAKIIPSSANKNQ